MSLQGTVRRNPRGHTTFYRTYKKRIILANIIYTTCKKARDFYVKGLTRTLEENKPYITIAVHTAVLYLRFFPLQNDSVAGFPLEAIALKGLNIFVDLFTSHLISIK